MYHVQVSDDLIGGDPICYNIHPYATKSTTSSNVTVSVDCLDYLGGDSNAALVRVRSVPRENSRTNAWQSHVIIDATRRGLCIGDTDSRIFSRFMFFGCSIPFQSLISLPVLTLGCVELTF